MATLLRIDASSRIEGSYSREMADFFQQHWQDQSGDYRVITRDLISQPISHIEDMTIKGYYTPSEEHDDVLTRATALSDLLIDEVFSADALLISTPMYNFTVPSSLKAYIDQIARTGKTFSYDETTGIEGLVTGKKAYVITAAGAVMSDVALAGMNHLNPYLRIVLGFIGIQDVVFFNVEGTTTDKVALQQSINECKTGIGDIFNKDRAVA